MYILPHLFFITFLKLFIVASGTARIHLEYLGSQGGNGSHCPIFHPVDCNRQLGNVVVVIRGINKLF